jgi:predicted dehydrogenase
VFSDPGAIFADPAIDAVLVLTHADTHLEMAAGALSAGKHVLVEKPVARDATAIEALADQARTSGLVCMPNHNYACVPEFRRMKRMADAGDLGTVRSFFVTYVIPHSEELASRYGGILEEVMVHHSYLSLSILGKPDHVVGGTAKPAWRRHPREDQAWMTWQYDRGTSAHLFASFATDDFSNEPWTCMVKALGTNGSAVVNWRSAVFKRAIGTHAMAWDQYEESFADAMALFRDTILHREPLPSTLDDAATAARIIGAAYHSARTLTVVPRVDARGHEAW